jgi:simple sugar transport system permease protein
MTSAFVVAIVTLVTSTLRASTPLTLAALGGTFSERSGVVNIALEGIMLMGAWAAVYFSYLGRDVWGMPDWTAALVGVLGAILVGVLTSVLHAVASVNFRANQVVSGTAINLLASGFTEFMLMKVWKTGQSPSVAKVGDIFGINAFVYIALILVGVSHFVLWYTPWGLRLRAVGEHPRAADTVGVNVARMRYWGVLLSGVFAGLAGASLSIGMISRFNYGMTAGRGYIALAAMIFGKWTPLGSLGACLLFGAADALGTLFQILNVHVPTQFLQMAPYVITMLALAGLIGRSTAPAADGIPYDKSH